MTTTVAAGTTDAPHCHVGTGWADFSECVGQCRAAGYRWRQRHFSDFLVAPGSARCGDVQCAVPIVEDGACVAAAGVGCNTHGVKFGLAFTAGSYEDAVAQTRPVLVAVADAVQICLETNCLNSFELSSARLHWNSEDLPVVASQLSLLALDSDEQTVGRAILNFPVVQSSTSSSQWISYDSEVTACSTLDSFNASWFAGFSLNTTSSTMADFVRSALLEVLDVPDTMVDSWFQNALMRGDQAFSSSLVGYVRPVKITFPDATDSSDTDSIITGYGSVNDAPYLIVWGVVTAAVFAVFVGIAIVVVCRRQISIARDSKNWQIWESVPSSSGNMHSDANVP